VTLFELRNGLSVVSSLLGHTMTTCGIRKGTEKGVTIDIFSVFDGCFRRVSENSTRGVLEAFRTSL